VSEDHNHPFGLIGPRLILSSISNTRTVDILCANQPELQALTGVPVDGVDSAITAASKLLDLGVGKVR